MEKILVPLDGSSFGEHGLPTAVALARLSGASLVLAHVHQIVVQAAALAGAPAFDLTLDTLVREQEAAYLDAVAQRVAAVWEGPVEQIFLEAPVAMALRDYAQEQGMSLIVMSSHGRGGIARAWLGSVADSLIRQATVPVLVVHPGEGKPDLAQAPSLHHILIPLDGSPLAEQALELAQRVGRPMQARYTLLQAVAPALRGFLIDGLDPEVDVEAEAAAWQQAANYLLDLAARLRAAGCEVQTEAVIGAPAGAILDYAQTYGADLIVMMTHGRGGVARLMLGSVADKVLRGTLIPMLLQRPPEA